MTPPVRRPREARQLLFGVACLLRLAREAGRSIPKRYRGVTNRQAANWYEHSSPSEKWQHDISKVGVLLASASSRLATLDKLLGSNGHRDYVALLKKGTWTTEVSERNKLLGYLHWMLRDDPSHPESNDWGKLRAPFLGPLKVLRMIRYLGRIERRVRPEAKARLM